MNHIAFIMDGNRRWAKEHHLPSLMGHTEGAKTMKKIVKAVKDRGIPFMTVYALSTENLKRAQDELGHLFSLIGKLAMQYDDLVAENIRLRIIGNLSLLPPELEVSLRETEEKTKTHTSLTLTLAIAYGGRDELIRAIQKIEQPSDITAETFEALLDTVGIPDVDMIVRTGGHQRLSNFLLWQSAYAELYFTDTYWPGFDEGELDKALTWFTEQQRNYGK
jgi:undecaprenyl diphosphate synthase